MALDTCKQLMDLSIGELIRSLDGIGELDLKHVGKILMNLKVWLSGAITYQDTCLDGFENTTSEAGEKMKDLLTKGMHISSNVLCIVTQLDDSVSLFQIGMSQNYLGVASFKILRFHHGLTTVESLMQMRVYSNTSLM